MINLNEVKNHWFALLGILLNSCKFFLHKETENENKSDS